MEAARLPVRAAFLVLLFFPPPQVSAQSPAQPTPLTEGQKREFQLSYVRPTTDCLARAISADSAAIEHALGERWGDALAVIESACRAHLTRMVAQYDRLYGEGTGEAFLKNTYLSDLPRALLPRLTPEFERRATE